MVYDILNGKTCLQDSGLKIVFARIVERIAGLINLGMQPPRAGDDPVEWRPRRFNKKADAICNIVLDTGAEVEYLSDDLQEVLNARPHLLAYTDGGTRNAGEGHATLGTLRLDGCCTLCSQTEQA